MADIHPMAMTGGQKQRMAISCAVAANKEIILLDEPISGFDYIRMQQTAIVL